MDAVVITGPYKVEVRACPVPTMQAPTDAIVKIELCGLCGSDLHPFRGKEPVDPGTIMGHEFVGTVVETGARARGAWSVGASRSARTRGCAMIIGHRRPSPCHSQCRIGRVQSQGWHPGGQRFYDELRRLPPLPERAFLAMRPQPALWLPRRWQGAPGRPGSVHQVMNGGLCVGYWLVCVSPANAWTL